MENNSNFTATLLSALDAKTQWYDSEELPAMLDNYRLLHNCVKSLYEYLTKKSLITPDPYKLDKKISGVRVPDSGPFAENEKALVMGIRFSDYDSILDFICNYLKFSVINLDVANIKKLSEFNQAIQWTSFTPNNPKTNTRTLAAMLLDSRQNSDNITASMINDSLTKAAKAVNAINLTLKGLAEFQKEYYKGQIRKNVFEHPNFDMSKALSSPQEEMTMIKKCYVAVMGKTPFYTELVDELIREDQAPNKETLQKKVLDFLNVAEKKNKKAEVKVDTKEMLVSALKVLGAMTELINVVVEKIQSNHDLLQSEHNTFLDKVKKLFRQAFNIEEKPLFYQIVLIEGDTKKHERINYNQFITDLISRGRRFAAGANKNTSTFQKLMAMPEDKLLEYVSQQILDSNKMLAQLNGLDEFFKVSAAPEDKSKVKGLKIEISSLKNTIVKANQHRAEYAAFTEEEAQLKKLGITND